MTKLSARSTRFTRFPVLLLVTLATLALVAGEAAAFLHRVGPINPAPSVGSFPAWYQDTTGLTLEFCDPKSDAELDGGWCLLTRNDVPPGTAGVLAVPEVFPTNFFDEHFWYAADAIPVSTNPLIKKAILVMAVEAAFAANVVPGGQIAFSRIRVRLDDVPVTGTYRFIHPYGEEIIEGVAGERIFFTDDVGIACALGDFSCALTSRLGPFLLPSNTPGGAELPPVVGPAPDNNLYIADPGRSGPVTGSPTGNNFFRIEGPPGSNLDGNGNDFLQTNNFALMGRILSGAIPGDVTVDRANYARNNAGQKVEVFATGFETTQGRLPGEEPAPAVMPVLSFFDAPCASALDNNLDPIPPFSAPVDATETQMFNADNSFWAQNTQIAAIPVSVCVKDNVSRTYFPKTVGDEITITEAYFDPNSQSLSVKARSSDEVAQPTLTLGGFADLANGAILVSPLAAPPAHVHVNSAGGGSNSLQVTTTSPAAIAIPPIAAVTLIPPQPASPQFLGTPVKWVAFGEGGSGTYEYRFLTYSYATGEIIIRKDYTVPGNSWTWDNTTGLTAGTYSVAVWVRSAGSTAAWEAVDGWSPPYEVRANIPAATGVTLNPPSLPGPQASPYQPVLWTASASGGSGTYEYAFWLLNNATGVVTRVKDYSVPGDSFNWDPATLTPGSYSVEVWARSAGSATAWEAYTSSEPYILQ